MKRVVLIALSALLVAAALAACSERVSVRVTARIRDSGVATATTAAP